VNKTEAIMVWGPHLRCASVSYSTRSPIVRTKVDDLVSYAVK
jgi:hypothetical protein